MTGATIHTPGTDRTIGTDRIPGIITIPIMDLVFMTPSIIPTITITRTPGMADTTIHTGIIIRITTGTPTITVRTTIATVKEPPTIQGQFTTGLL